MSGEKTTAEIPAARPPNARTIHRAKLLLTVLSALFALWMAAMLVMYFKTVYPVRHPPSHLAK